MQLLNTQRNSLFNAINDSQAFSPNQFDFYESTAETTLTLKKTGYFFSVRDGSVHGIQITMSPGQDRMIQYDVEMEWEKTLIVFQEWLYFLGQEISTPNLWAKLSDSVNMAELSTSQSDSQFTVSEYQDLKQRMISLSAQMKMLPFLAEQHEEVSAKLDNLVILAEKLSKFDWTNLFIGTIMNIVVALSLTPENSQALFQLIKSIFKGYFLQ